MTTAVLLAVAAPLTAGAADRGVAEEILARAIESYRSGSFEPAIGGINAALRGGLSSAQTAQALYYRGLAHRKQGRPGYAISDLSRALDYDALSEAERSDAMEARSAAYQEAGIADQETVVVAAPGTDRRGDAQVAPVARVEATRLPEVPKAVTTAAIVPPPSAQPAATKWGGSTQVAVAAPFPLPASTAAPKSNPALAPEAAAKPVPKAAAPASPAEPAAAAPAKARPKPQAAQAPPSAAKAKPAEQTAAATGWKTDEIMAAPLPPVPAPLAAKPKAPAPVTQKAWRTEQVAVAPLPPAAPQAKPTAPAKPSIGAEPKTAPLPVRAEPPTPFVTQVAALTPPAPPILPAAMPTPAAASAAPPVAAPEFRLLVGETRSRGEAYALAIRLTSQRGSGLGRRKPQIAPGTMADVVVYRVRLGPFADAGEAQALCGSLRSSGYPCILE